MKRLSILLSVILLAFGLTACGARADEPKPITPEPMASASVDLSGDADSLMSQAKTLAEEANELDARLWGEQLGRVTSAKDAAAAEPELAKARGLLDRVSANEQSIVALLDQVVRLDVSEELAIYAGQQKEIAELQLEGITAEEDFFTRTEALFREKGKIDEMDFYALMEDLSDPGLNDQREGRGLALVEFFKQSGLPKRYFINNGLFGYGDMFGLDESSMQEEVPEVESP